jgi:hypothetical protein
MIWSLMQESSHIEEKATAEATLSQEYANEMSEWVALTNKLSAQIEDMRCNSDHQHVSQQVLAENARLHEDNVAMKAQLNALLSKLESIQVKPTVDTTR